MNPVLQSIKDLRDWRKAQVGRMVLVPTMGALHAGHLSLVKKARDLAGSHGQVLVSVFVNPTQFAPGEDFDKYPKQLEADTKLAIAAGADRVFAPARDEVYHADHSVVLEESSVSQALCGRFRPGHFSGVMTVVLKLFNLCQPQDAIFGIKDAQQFFVLLKMVRDLNLPIRLWAAPIIREGDGLAMSSRNAFLSAEDRERAAELYRVLQGVMESWNCSPKEPGYQYINAAWQQLEQKGFRPQYLECVELPGFRVMGEQDLWLTDSSYLLATAAFLGDTRLIDNVILGSPELMKEYWI